MNILKFLGWLYRRLEGHLVDAVDTRTLAHHARDMAQRTNFSLSAVAASFRRIEGVTSVVRTRQGYLVKTADRTVIELHGSGDLFTGITLNPGTVSHAPR